MKRAIFIVVENFWIRDVGVSHPAVRRPRPKTSRGGVGGDVAQQPRGNVRLQRRCRWNRSRWPCSVRTIRDGTLRSSWIRCLGGWSLRCSQIESLCQRTQQHATHRGASLIYRISRLLPCRWVLLLWVIIPLLLLLILSLLPDDTLEIIRADREMSLRCQV